MVRKRLAGTLTSGFLSHDACCFVPVPRGVTLASALRLDRRLACFYARFSQQSCARYMLTHSHFSLVSCIVVSRLPRRFRHALIASK